MIGCRAFAYLLYAGLNLPVKTTADLISYGKEKREGLTYGSSGVGAASHLSGLLFAGQTGIKMLHIPYKGTGPAVTDLIGGRIDIMFAPGPVVQQFVQSGQLKALGVTDTQRSKFYPDVPTVADTVPGYESVGWFGLLAPPKTPPEIVKKINEVIVAGDAPPGVSATGPRRHWAPSLYVFRRRKSSAATSMPTLPNGARS